MPDLDYVQDNDYFNYFDYFDDFDHEINASCEIMDEYDWHIGDVGGGEMFDTDDVYF